MLNIESNFYDDYYNWILWLPVFFIIGILLYYQFIFFHYIFYFALSIFTFLSFFAKKVIKIFFIAISIIILGYIRSNHYLTSIVTPIINQYAQNVIIKGKIHDINFYQRNNRTMERIIVKTDNMPSKYIRINLKEQDIVQYGDYVELIANIMPIGEQFFPYSYNQKREFFQQEIGAVAYAGEINYIFRPDNITIRDKFYNIRQVLNEHIISIVGEKNGSLIGSFITGIRGKITSEDYNSLINAGLVHLIAISGMNMAIAMGLFYAILRRIFAENVYLTTNYEIKKLCAFFAIVIGFLYLCITGFPISAVRAYIMSSLFFMGIILDKPTDVTRFLCFTAFCILFVEPSLLFDIGFQLSFLAVLGLISIFYLFYKGTSKWYLKPIFYVYSVILSTIIAEIGVSPLSIFHFNTYNPYTILANAIAVPISTIITMPLIATSVFLFPFGLEKYSLIPTSWSIDFILKLSQWIEKISTIYLIRTPHLMAIFVMLFGFLWLCLWKEKWRYWGIYIFAIGICLSFLPYPNVYIDKNDGLITYIEDGNVYFSNTKNKFKLETIAKKLGKSEYKKLENSLEIENARVKYY